MNTNQSRMAAQEQFAMECLFAEKNGKFIQKTFIRYYLRRYLMRRQRRREEKFAISYQVTA
ncbi:hypothetical protein J1779_09725 [Rahnella sp. FC061912-K]|uniref:hypothetical protein n=1 Tax=Rahnella rivi TaxID=2816249 RepID=UPI001C26886B|nr:hypothetical protein [Rahnella rivi]MBU9830217.1 hypothetical protein [Rahnella rivi]